MRVFRPSGKRVLDHASIARRTDVRRAKRPILFMLVYGVSLVLVGVTASSQAALVSTNYQTAVMESTVANDAGLVSALVNTSLLESDITPARSPARTAALTELLHIIAVKAGLARVELRDLDGRLLAADLAIGDLTRPADANMRSAIEQNRAIVSLVDGATAGQAGPALGPASLLREDLPLATADKRVRAMVSAWRDAGPILRQMEETRTGVVLLTLTAAIVLAFILYFVFKSAQDRIARQTAALVEATRRDPMTGLLNHGGIVERLVAVVDEAGRFETGVSIALVDIDNFRLINDTHGLELGDQALMTVASVLERLDAPDLEIGRYGPDEFLVFAPGTAAALENVIRGVRDELVDSDGIDASGGRLPITVSAGICEFPADGRSVTALLALVARTLQEAKSSGGDAVRIARADPEGSVARGFDVLQGLVIAIDTKDRYTKRHSEDVARYGLFIASRLNLDAEIRRIVRLAGLLHDVGKIGIPDQVLRKPGRLTESEYAIVKQHVALGDMIVRDLPDLDAVRAGILNHHERVDGRG
jgi:diguanylate cyclase (GGDEF)-like protein